MKRRLTQPLCLLALLVAVLVRRRPGRLRRSRRRGAAEGFFGIGPQTALTDEDAEYMKAGGIESVRWPLPWAGDPADQEGRLQLDRLRRRRSRSPPAHGPAGAALPLRHAALARRASRRRCRSTTPGSATAWTAFLTRRGRTLRPRRRILGRARAGGVGPSYEPADPDEPLPIRTWQIWNEANFFYFAYPVSPQRYAKLLKISSPAIKAVDPGAKVILSGLFGEPTASGAQGDAGGQVPRSALPRRRGSRAASTASPCTPTRSTPETLEELVEELHEVTVENHDRVPLYITEMGWGSQNDFQQVAFEQGIQGQVQQLRGAYGYLLENRNRLDLKQVYWFSWKDLPDSCNFCDSVGLFRAGAEASRPKPAWRAFVALTGGRAAAVGPRRA